ncbi:IPT/TIG domain-containing protein [Streptomyces sp. SL13]|uniref:IPT/TIG domain-containing protein n=1 Tax=Streptantibioticus silvisoli TaxID=2705255 RepID=A0AA90H558_9ACTN|nr:IPT/TIG domain-containing protein [Streptantibioticus silvisoli]MDI5970849.1 IPT/TIG domain-containing protein [Streptantibioticus silvisoli]
MQNHPSSPAVGAGPLAPLVAPTITVCSPASGPAGVTVTLTGTGFTGVTSIAFGAVPSTSFTVSSATRITAVAPAGTGTVQITVTGPSGTSNGIDFTYTTTAPVITTPAPAQGPVAGGNTVTLTGTALTGATAVRFGATAASFTAVSATQVTAIAPPGAAGAVSVTITTPGGTSAGVTYTYLAAATLTGLTPAQGTAAGGNTVTLTGTALTGATAVRFGSAAATSFTVVSGTQISAVPPSGAAGAVPVVVTTPAGATAGDVFYYYLPAPALTSAVPGSGPVAGSTAVVLSGSGLVTAIAVRFGAAPAATFTVVSDVRVDATAPAGAAGTVAVTVVTPAGTSNGLGYTYVTVPVLTSLVPNAGPPAGGNTVTLAGSGLTTTTSVLFGGVPAAFAVLSDSVITATAPAGAAGPVGVTAVTPGGTTAGLPYTRVAAPGI